MADYSVGDLVISKETPEWGPWKIKAVKDYGYEITKLGARSAADSRVLDSSEAEQFWQPYSQESKVSRVNEKSYSDFEQRQMDQDSGREQDSWDKAKARGCTTLLGGDPNNLKRCTAGFRHTGPHVPGEHVPNDFFSKRQESVERIVSGLLKEDGDTKTRISYIGGGTYSVEVSKDVAVELQRAYPKSFRKPHENPNGNVWFGCTEKGSKIAAAFLKQKSVAVHGSSMWDREPGEMPSW